ncbi:MAG: hypothetical protein M5U28_28745 [Sandaracinaceae bacterium]|nr:hypothetical protein [Sandaracinaceae bacterium]
MARAARTVQEQLRKVIEAARARSGAMTEADVLAACVGLAEPVAVLPTRDLEDDIVWMKGAPELSPSSRSREDEPSHELSPSRSREGAGGGRRRRRLARSPHPNPPPRAGRGTLAEVRCPAVSTASPERRAST